MPLEPARSRAQTVALIAAAALIVISAGVGGALLATRGDGPSAAPVTSSSAEPTTPPPSAATTVPPTTAPPTVDPVQLTQAQGLDALLTRTADSRDTVSEAVPALQACTSAPADAQLQFATAARSRQDLLGELEGQDLGALPEGAALRTQLALALQASADADEAFASWATRLVEGCTPGAPDPDLETGLALSASQAKPAKERFVAAWNPVAARFALAARNPTEL